jgi:hypothetical protein
MCSPYKAYVITRWSEADKIVAIFTWWRSAKCMAVCARPPSHKHNYTVHAVTVQIRDTMCAAGFLLRAGNHGSDDSKTSKETATSAVQFWPLSQEYSHLIQNHLSWRCTYFTMSHMLHGAKLAWMNNCSGLSKYSPFVNIGLPSTILA